MQQEIIIATISIVVATLIASPLLISNVYAHGVTGKTVILSDEQGNWNPDGTRTSWTIVDPDFSPLTSTVLVNIKSYPDYNVCNVDYMYGAGAFSVTCITHHRLGEPNNVCCSVGGPANGAELHYTIFNPSFPLPVGGLASEVETPIDEDLLTMSKNRTQGNDVVVSPEQQGLSANVTGADGR